MIKSDLDYSITEIAKKLNDIDNFVENDLSKIYALKVDVDELSAFYNKHLMWHCNWEDFWTTTRKQIMELLSMSLKNEELSTNFMENLRLRVNATDLLHSRNIEVLNRTLEKYCTAPWWKKLFKFQRESILGKAHLEVNLQYDEKINQAFQALEQSNKKLEQNTQNNKKDNNNSSATSNTTSESTSPNTDTTNQDQSSAKSSEI